MEKTLMGIEYVSFNDLHTYESKSIKYTAKEIELTSNVLKHFGFQFPLVVDESNRVIVGEHLLLAADKLGIQKIPVVSVNNLRKQEIKAFRIAAKKILEFGEFDVSELKLEIDDLLKDAEFDFTFDICGFDAVEFDNLMFVEDEKSTPQKEETLELNNITPLTKAGDLIQLGEHLLYCRDALNKTSYQVLMRDNKANLVLTDPPYNVQIQNNVTKRTHHDEFEQASGEMTEAEFENFLQQAFNNLKEFSKENSLHYLFMDWRHAYTLQSACKNIYPKLNNICVWDKTKGGMGSFYRSQHEFCFVYQNGTGKYTNNIQLGSNGRNRSNVWQYPGMNIATKQANKLGKLHPTVKSTAMLVDILLDASKPGDIVLDCFGGSGSTLIAAEQCKRKAMIIELSPHYCDVIIHRWEELTGSKHCILSREGE